MQDDDNNPNFLLDGTDNGPTYSAFFQVFQFLPYVNPLTTTINASEIAGDSSVSVSNGTSSILYNGVGNGFNYASGLDFVIIGDADTEEYTVNSVTIVANATDTAAVSEPAILGLLGLGLLGISVASRRRG